MGTRPVILTEQVCLTYRSGEVTNLLKAATQLPPYEIQEFTHYLRIDCFSLIGRGWRCAFIISKASTGQKSWMLDSIEYLPQLTLHHALAALGHIELHGLKRLKYGL
jgi:hypothetical protein